jgi:predicted N-acyltransferase
MRVIASTPFMGPLVTTEEIAPTLVALEDVFHRWKVDHVEIAFPTLLDVIAASKLGYTTEVCQAVVINLAGRTVDQLWRGLSSACRQAVRKAEASGVETEVARDISFVDEYYRMCEEVYRGSGRPPHLTKAFYVAAWDVLAARGKIKVMLATCAGEVLAGGIFLLHRETAYYLSGASYDRGLRLRPNNLIQWRFIEWAISQGYRLYDMGGAVIPGITRFKLSFGGRLYSYTRLYRANSTLARLGRIVYKRGIPLWRRLCAWQHLRHQSL